MLVALGTKVPPAALDSWLRPCRLAAVEATEMVGEIDQRRCKNVGADDVELRPLLRRRAPEAGIRQHDRTRAEARAHIFDYIERCHKPRQRRRLDMQQQGERPLTQPSVITG